MRLMEDYIILELFWNRQIVKSAKGKVSEIFRGVDYDLDWVKLGESFAKFEKMIFHYDEPCFEKLKKIIDFDSFDIVATNENNTHYFRDRLNVYLKSNMGPDVLLQTADPNTFKVVDIEKGLSKDSLRYYYYENPIPFDLATADVLNDYFTRAEGKIFFCFKEISGADAVSFTVIHENLGKDKTHVYFKGQIVAGAHSATFQLLAGCVGGAYYDTMSYTCYAKDSEMAYFIDCTAKTVKPIKSKSLSQFRFEVVKEQGVCFDNEYRYYFGKRTKIGK
jgi:hypothetical protein